jgi:hypothetical protein
MTIFIVGIIIFAVLCIVSWMKFAYFETDVKRKRDEIRHQAGNTKAVEKVEQSEQMGASNVDDPILRKAREYSHRLADLSGLSDRARLDELTYKNVENFIFRRADYPDDMPWPITDDEISYAAASVSISILQLAMNYTDTAFLEGTINMFAQEEGFNLQHAWTPSMVESPQDYIGGGFLFL